MTRYIMIITGGIVVCILGLVVMNMVDSPMKARSEDLQVRLLDNPVQTSDAGVDVVPVEEWNRVILAKNTVWRSLVAPPPPPPPLPPPPPQEPKVEQMLAGVSATRQQVGDKVKFVLPDNPKGEFLGVGDSINNVAINSISKTEVVFIYNWAPGNKVLTYTMPRN